jgi:hypothetical protein
VVELLREKWRELFRVVDVLFDSAALNSRDVSTDVHGGAFLRLKAYATVAHVSGHVVEVGPTPDDERTASMVGCHGAILVGWKEVGDRQDFG